MDMEIKYDEVTIDGDFFLSSNCRYIIRYNHNLSQCENIIPIGENSILEFQGGSLEKANIKGNNTKITAIPYLPIFIDCTFSGTFDALFVQVSWFSTSFNTISHSEQIQTAIDFTSICQCRTLLFPTGNFIIDRVIFIGSRKSERAQREVSDIDVIKYFRLMILGQGIDSGRGTVLIFKGNAEFRVDLRKEDNGVWRGVKFQNLLILGDGNNSRAKGITFCYSQLSSIEKCRFGNLECGITFTDDSHYNKIEGCTFESCNKGVIESKNNIQDASSNCNIIFDSYFYGCETPVHTGYGWTILANDFEGENGTIILTKFTSFLNNRIERNKNDKVWLEITGNDNTVICSFDGIGQSTQTWKLVNRGSRNRINAVYNTYNPMAFISLTDGNEIILSLNMAGLYENRQPQCCIFAKKDNVTINGVSNRDNLIDGINIIKDYNISVSSNGRDSTIYLTGYEVKHPLGLVYELDTEIGKTTYGRFTTENVNPSDEIYYIVDFYSDLLKERIVKFSFFGIEVDIPSMSENKWLTCLCYTLTKPAISNEIFHHKSEYGRQVICNPRISVNKPLFNHIRIANISQLSNVDVGNKLLSLPDNNLINPSLFNITLDSDYVIRTNNGKELRLIDNIFYDKKELSKIVQYGTTVGVLSGLSYAIVEILSKDGKEHSIYEVYRKSLNNKFTLLPVVINGLKIIDTNSHGTIVVTGFDSSKHIIYVIKKAPEIFEERLSSFKLLLVD